jgi:hypothetical protein
MPHFAVIDAPSILGLKPNGVQFLPDALKTAGLLAALNAEHAGRVEPPPYNPRRDPETLILNPESLSAYSLRLAAAVAGVVRQGKLDQTVYAFDSTILDKATKKHLVFLTNNFDLPAITIDQLCKCRWQVELFFKWIKQHLRIKAFYGTTENAVKIQIWIAISIYVLVAIVKKRLKLDRSLYTILQILSVSLFEKTPILQVLSATDYEFETPYDDNQLILHQ